MRGLIVDEPWLSLLLRGEKVWEMRSRATSIRGRIALIRKGSGTVVGVSDLVDCIGPLDSIAWRAHVGSHCIPLWQQEATSNWNVAWVMRNARPLVDPVPYDHPPGAVIWVRLPSDFADRIQVDHGSVRHSKVDIPTPDRPVVARSSMVLPDIPPSETQLVPVARDGSWFSPALRRSRGFTIGPKGEEVVVEGYGEALAQLRAMATPRWRRPNAEGNWGIVSAVRWELTGQVKGSR